MASYNEEEYEKVIRSNALRAFKRLQELDPKKYTYNVRNADEVKRKYSEYQDKLRKWRPIDQMTRGYEYALNDYSADSLYNWLEGVNGAKAPDEYEGQTEASKILPLLAGIAKENEDWYSMDSKSLQNEAKRLGYNTNIPGAYQEFLNLVRDYQTQYDRAQLLKEGQQGANYWLNKLFFPASTQEAENAILTGQGGDKATLNKLRALDAVTSGVMLGAPSLAFTKVNPLLMGTIDAGIQGAAEAGRQYGLEQLSGTGQKADYGQALLALMTGATRPGIATSATGMAAQLPTGAGRDFARGVSKAARTGGSAERADLAKAVKLYNDKIVGKGAVADFKNELGTAVKVPEIAKMYGIKPMENGKYSAKKILAAYDTPVERPHFIVGDKYIYPENSQLIGPNSIKPVYVVDEGKVVVKPNVDDMAKVGTGTRKPNPKSEQVFILGDDKVKQFQSLFPDRALDIDQNRTAALLGRVIGRSATEIGGRIEPTIKSNPFDVADKGTVRKSYIESYKDQPWYKNLNVESQKIIDEAFKKKDKEDKEE